MAQIKPLTDTSGKWGRRAGSAGPEYEQGVKNPKREWEASTKAAEVAYEQGVQAAIGRKAFGKGVTGKQSRWQTKAAEVGSGRYGGGVQAAVQDYEQGFAPYHQTISSLSLPPRGAKGSPQNLQRVAAVANALRARKVGK